MAVSLSAGEEAAELLPFLLSFRLHLYSRYHFSYKLERRGVFSLEIRKLQRRDAF